MRNCAGAKNKKFSGAPTSLARNSAAAESEGGEGIPFPSTPFSACPTRAVWFLPRRRRGIIRDFVQKRFERRSVIATNKDILKIGKGWIARLPRLRRVSLRKKPCISELNRKGGQIQIQFFGKANGDSAGEARNPASAGYPIFSVSCQRQKYKASFSIPRFRSKATL